VPSMQCFESLSPEKLLQMQYTISALESSHKKPQEMESYAPQTSHRLLFP